LLEKLNLALLYWAVCNRKP